MKVLYFARVRQIVGRGQDDVELPATVATVDALMAFLAARDEGCAAAFAEPKALRAAVDHKHVALDATIIGAGEVAFFPPVTGG